MPKFRIALRLEALLLGVALVWTIGTKLWYLRSAAREHLALSWIAVSACDFVFFSSVALGITLAYVLGPPRVVARLAIFVSGVVLVWSLISGAWVVASGLQMQVGIMVLLFEDLGDFVPVVWDHVLSMRFAAIPICLAVLLTPMPVLFRFLFPVRLRATRRRQKRLALGFGVALAASVMLQLLLAPYPKQDLLRSRLGFNNHWAMVVTAIRNAWLSPLPATELRKVYESGERTIGLPSSSMADAPNVVLLMLESVSYPVTSLHDAKSEMTPNILRLAREGAELGPTYVAVPQTTKAYWALLTGTYPDMEPDVVEAVLRDKPYEALATVLGREGYRSAFFSMALGAFKSAPATLANLGFDHVWFRENLGDETKFLGYMSGDDVEAIEPAFDWACSKEGPFLLTMITSFAHDPYEVPEWFETPATGTYEKYLQTVRCTDYFVGKVLAELAERGLDDNTLICLVGDHGQGFRHNDRFGRWVPHEEVIRVPWVMHWRGHIEAGTRARWCCSEVDVTPTILSMLGFDLSQAGFEGRNALVQPSPGQRSYFSSWFADSPMGYVEGEKKWFYWPYVDQVFLLDLASDPKELSPTIVLGDPRRRVIEDVTRWRSRLRIDVPEGHSAEALLFDHWRTGSYGRQAWIRFEP